jgi:hypothetical protein
MASAPVAISGFDRAGFFRRRRFSNAELLWLAFVIVQALDGAMSYIGVFLHGHAIEGNPLIAWYLTAFGPAIGFTAAKLFAVACGAVLYMTARYRWVAALTVVYLVFAVIPWIGLLSVGI